MHDVSIKEVIKTANETLLNANIECPSTWYPYILECFKEVYAILYIYGYQPTDIDFQQVKSKWDKLVIYYMFLPLINNESEDEIEFRKLSTIDDIISIVINKHERHVNFLIENGKL